MASQVAKPAPHLPAEILTQIFEHFSQTHKHVAYRAPLLFKPSNEYIATLRACSHTCRSFYSAAAPLLWRNVCLGGHQGPSTRQLISLIRFWHARPDIPALVQTMYLSNPALPNRPQSFSEDDYEFLLGLQRELDLRLFEKDDDLTNDTFDILNTLNTLVIVLAIFLARQVRVLDVSISSMPIITRLATFKDTSLRFNALASIRCYLGDEHSIADIAPLLRLAPKLTDLDIWPAYLGPIKAFDWSGITTFTLRGSLLNTAELVQVITSCRALQSVTLTVAFQHRGTRNSPEHVFAALATHAGTLRHLEISFDESMFSDLGSYGMGSVATFTALESLTIRMEEMGSEERSTLRTLPASLVRLEIRDYPFPESVNVVDVEWLADYIRDGGYPNLRQVVLAGWECSGDHAGTCRGRYCSEDHPYVDGVVEHEAREDRGMDDEDDDDCDGGETVTKLKKMLLDAGVKCTIADP